MNLSARLWVMSDIHRDVREFAFPIGIAADVLVIAGDFGGRLSRSMNWLRERKAKIPMPIVCVAGNHCFYGASLDAEIGKARALAPDDVHILDGDAVVVAGVRFVGATLWTDFRIGGEAMAHAAKGEARAWMRDYRKIRVAGGTRRASPAETVERHHLQRRALETLLSIPFAGPTVVVTHHAPHRRSLRTGRVTETLDAAYASDLSHVMERFRPPLWIHGHVHEQRDYGVGDTRILANPRGYIQELGFGRSMRLEVENPNFVADLVVPLDLRSA